MTQADMEPRRPAAVLKKPYPMSPSPPRQQARNASAFIAKSGPQRVTKKVASEFVVGILCHRHGARRVLFDCFCHRIQDAVDVISCAVQFELETVS